ncbi:GAF domain-containing protein [Nocardioides dongxiaopingii]|uniref:GAF domain-containing protein n=1 Tax=Nocardioides sp. S-1144 TaxID=2582905 RepID=UPI00110D6B1F|nr:GAF domain-containing protein [Nocardioides sp. S-1144]QCW51600.1 GAF domain-containing protein [Nocardioides sp. S-1144]
MEPTPGTLRADDAFGPFLLHGEDLLTRLQELAGRVQRVVPACMGMSVSLTDPVVTFTLASTDTDVALLDGVQYVAGGPCVHAAEVDETVHLDVTDDALDEARWHHFARAAASRGVASTLSLPMLDQTRVVGVFNLYASTPHAFVTRAAEVSSILGTWLEGAVLNADLAWSTREAAARGEAALGVATRLAVAATLLAGDLDITVEAGSERLLDAALRAGVSLEAMVGCVIDLLT